MGVNMKTQQWANPLLSMVASLAMCVILSVSHDAKASSKHANISINYKGDESIYHVDGKRFTFNELSPDDQKRVVKLEKQLAALEKTLDKKTHHIEKFSEKMEKVAEALERQARHFETAIEEADINDLEDASEKLGKASQMLERKMRVLEKQLRNMEFDMPEIDHAILDDIETQAHKLEELLVDIAKRI